MFFAELQAIGAAVDGGGGDVEPIVMGAERLGDEDADAPLVSVAGGGEAVVDGGLDGVSAVAEGLDGFGESGVEGLAELFESAEGFAEAFAGGDDDGVGVGAGRLGVGGQGGADVVGCVAVELDVGVERGEGGGEVVAEVFELFRKVGVIPGKACGVFEDAHGFAGAVGIGVEDAADVGHGGMVAGTGGNTETA